MTSGKKIGQKIEKRMQNPKITELALPFLGSIKTIDVIKNRITNTVVYMIVFIIDILQNHIHQTETL